MRIIKRDEALVLFKNQKVNLVTGSFDLVHAGHIDFLKQAKAHSPQIPLLVIVLDDIAIAARKGSDRPIYSLQDRLTILSAISYIDYLLPWENSWEEIRDFVERINLVNLFVTPKDPGLDNKMEIARNNGFKLVELKQYNEVSTTSIIERIKKDAKESK